MAKLNPTVRRESVFIAVCVLLCSVIMQAVFLLIRRWDYTVLTGNLLGGIAAVGNFVAMGYTVQQAVEQEEQRAREMMRTSRGFRTAFVVLLAVLGVCLPFFNNVAVILPLFFPRIGLFFRPLFDKGNADSTRRDV